MMSLTYSICGWIRVRKCAEVEEIIKQLRDCLGQGFEIDVSEVESDQLEISMEGGSLFAKGYLLGIEQLLCSLGPFASEGAVFSGVCDGQPWEVAVAPTEEAGRVALSRSRLEEIDPLVNDLIAQRYLPLRGSSGILRKSLQGCLIQGVTDDSGPNPLVRTQTGRLSR